MIYWPTQGNLFWMYYSFLKKGSDLIFLHEMMKSVYDRIRTYFSKWLAKTYTWRRLCNSIVWDTSWPSRLTWTWLKHPWVYTCHLSGPCNPLPCHPASTRYHRAAYLQKHKLLECLNWGHSYHPYFSDAAAHKHTHWWLWIQNWSTRKMISVWDVEVSLESQSDRRRAEAFCGGLGVGGSMFRAIRYGTCDWVLAVLGICALIVLFIIWWVIYMRMACLCSLLILCQQNYIFLDFTANLLSLFKIS